MCHRSALRTPAHKGHPVAGHLELDLLVEDALILELKAVEKLHPVHVAQLITYLKLTGCPAGLLLNFNQSSCAPVCAEWITPSDT